MSIFDRFRDIASFLNTRPEARTKEQEQIGTELEEAAKTAEDTAASRLEGVSESEANSFIDTIRDFLNSDQKNIDEFRKKNKEQIDRDKALFKKFTKLHPVKVVGDFLLNKAIRTYGPAVEEVATKFITGLTQEDVPKGGGQFEFMGTVYTDKDYFDAGRIEQSNEGLYGIDQGRSSVSNIKAFINLLPDDYSKTPAQVYNDFRQIKKNYPNTPFADFYDPSALKTSGLEYQLLVANRERPDTPVTKADLLALTETGGDLDPNVVKTRYNRGESNVSNIGSTIKKVDEALEQLGGFSTNRYVGQYFPELQQYLLDVRGALVTEQDRLRAGDRGDFTAEEMASYDNALYNEFTNRVSGVFEQLRNAPESFQRRGMIGAYENYENVITELLSQLQNNVLTALSPQGTGDTFPTGDRKPSYENMSVMGTKNYDVQAVTVAPRESLGENLAQGTHYSGDLKGSNRTDAFHYRTGMLEGDNGPVNYLIEVQSDHEERMRKSNVSYDPSVGIKLYELVDKNIAYANEKLPALENFYKIDESEKEKLDEIRNTLRYNPEGGLNRGQAFALQNKENPEDVYVLGPDGVMKNKDGRQFDSDEIDISNYKQFKNSKDLEFIPAGSPVMKTIIGMYFDGPAVMTDNIPAANLEKYLEKNTRADEILKFMKKNNEFRQDLFKQDKMNLENKEDGLSKTVPFAATPVQYAEKAIYEFIQDSIAQGVDKVSWVPGEVSIQIQFDRTSPSNQYVDHDTAFQTHHNQKQSQGMFDFYGSSKQPTDNHMYRAAEKVVDKIDKIGTRLYGESFVAPKLYEQGAQDDNGRFFSPIDNSYFAGVSDIDGKANPGIKEGWGFIDLKPMLDSIKEEDKQEVVKEILGSYVERKRGGQIESPSLLSLNEVING
tara:strand:- start:4087 stop:6756 length:2670 start_codon:yes stop_codon:yes gene_type:complete